MRIAIAEDSHTAAKQLTDCLTRFGEEFQIEIEYTVFSDGAQLVDNYKCSWDLVLLDIDMPGLDGIAAARAIRKVDPEVLLVFITNLSQYAIKGYEVKAMDYVLKPINYYTLSMKLQTAVKMLRRNEEKSLMLSQDKNMIRVPLSHLYYVEVYNHQLQYHTMEGDFLITGARTLSVLETELAPEGFFRCHKGYLINLRFADALAGNVVHVNGTEIPVARGRKKELLQALLGYIKGDIK